MCAFSRGCVRVGVQNEPSTPHMYCQHFTGPVLREWRQGYQVGGQAACTDTEGIPNDNTVHTQVPTSVDGEHSLLSAQRLGIPNRHPKPAGAKLLQAATNPALPSTARIHCVCACAHTHTQHQNLREWLVFAASWVKSPAPHMGTGSRPDCSMT